MARRELWTSDEPVFRVFVLLNAARMSESCKKKKKEWMGIHWLQWHQSVVIKSVGLEPDYLIITTLCASTPYVWKLETTIKCINSMVKIQLSHIVFSFWHTWSFLCTAVSLWYSKWSSIYMPAGKIVLFIFLFLSTAVIRRSVNVCGQASTQLFFQVGSFLA